MTFPAFEEIHPSPATPASTFGEVPWNWRDILVGVIGALFVFFVLVVAIVGTATAVWGEDSLEEMLATAVTTVLLDVVLVSTVVLVARRKGAGWPNLGFRLPRTGIITKDQARWTGLSVLIVVAYFGAIGAVTFYNLAIDLAGLDDLLPSPQLPSDFFDRDAVIVITGLAVVIGAPIAEEIFFRGFVFGGLRRYVGFPQAALVSGFLFSLAHGDPGLIVPFTAVGMILAFSYERSGTLLAPMGVHFIFNTVSFSLLLAFPELR